MIAVDERQALEALTRDEKAAARTCSHLDDKQQELVQRRARLSEDGDVQGRKKTEVS